MPVKIRCSGCEKVLNVPDAARGKAVKCPGCGGKIPVPAGAKTAKAGQKTPQKKRPAPAKAAVEDDDFLANIDLRNLEDTSVRLCPKCGTEADEEDIDCAKCGVNLETGLLSAAAKKKLDRKGPDPSLYFQKAWKDPAEFLGKHRALAIRTSVYALIFTLVGFGCAYMVLWCSRTPPKVFWSFCSFVAFMAPPGWTWFLHTEVIRTTVAKKAKMDRVNFDFFLSAALGIKFIAWLAAFPLGLGVLGIYLATRGSEVPGLILLGVALFAAFLMFPIAMVHMTMPVTYRGWLLPTLIGPFFKTMGGSLYWCLILFVTFLPLIGGLAAIGAVYGSDLQEFVVTQRFNTLVAAAAAETEPPKPAKPDEEQPEDPLAAYRGQQPRELDAQVLIVPSVVWVLCCAGFGFAAVYNMRSNGLFAVYFHRDLELITLAKEVKYVAKAGEEEGEEKTKSTVNVVWALAVLSLVGGVVAGVLTGETMRYMIGGAVAFVAWIPVAGMWRVFEKAEKPGWATFVPVYNAVVMHQIAGKPEWWVALYLVPLVGLVVLFLVSKGIAEKFGQGTGFAVGLTLLNVVFFPILGFGKYKYAKPPAPAKAAKD